MAAVVWRQNTVTIPSRTPDSVTFSCTSSVMSMNWGARSVVIRKESNLAMGHGSVEISLTLHHPLSGKASG